MNVVRHTGTPKGRGVYAGRLYLKGEIVEVSPVVVLDMAFDDLPDVLKQRVFDWSPVLDINMAIALGHGSLFNHANPANLKYTAKYKEQELIFTAARDIMEGEELTINYSSAYGDPECSVDRWFGRLGIQPVE